MHELKNGTLFVKGLGNVIQFSRRIRAVESVGCEGCGCCSVGGGCGGGCGCGG